MSDQCAAEIQLITGPDVAAVAESVWACYETAFGDSVDFRTWRSELFDRHAARDGYRLAVAFENDTIVGFSWGYIGQRGQYWSDLAHDALPPEIAAAWVGGHFELVELGVVPASRGLGLGQALHDRVLEGIERRCLLSTSDDETDPAVRLYRRSGWWRLGELRPGVQVMGREIGQISVPTNLGQPEDR